MFFVDVMNLKYLFNPQFSGLVLGNEILKILITSECLGVEVSDGILYYVAFVISV